MEYSRGMQMVKASMHQMKMHNTIRVNSTATTTTSTSSNKVKKNLTQVKEVPKEKTGMKIYIPDQDVTETNNGDNDSISSEGVPDTAETNACLQLQSHDMHSNLAVSSSSDSELQSGPVSVIKSRHMLAREKRHVTKQRPERFCIYCNTVIYGGKLKRHIIRSHKTEDEVKEAMLKPSCLQQKFFETKRVEGIYAFNLQQLSQGQEEKPNLMRERKPCKSDMLRMCSYCKRFLSNKSFYKHKQICSGINADSLKPEMIASTDVHKDKQFVKDILSRFRNSEIGKLCQNDELIKQVGFRHYCLRRHEASKMNEIKKTVMSEMRELARLFVTFQSLTENTVTTEDMFTRKYLPHLREAIEKMVEPSLQGKEKYGLKLNINAIIQRTIKSLKGFYTETQQDDKYEEIGKFQMAYAFRSHEIFSGARFQCLSQTLNKSRKPDQLPNENELKMLKDFISSEMTQTVKVFDINKYTWLRSLVVCRLTLYNGRRGEEPSRMLLSQWEDAMNNVWLPSEKIEQVEDEAERFLIGQFRLAYLHGKGKKFVPVLVPEDTIEPIQMLVRNRQQYGICENNTFLFATKQSINHCSGWHAVKSVCNTANISINATKNRHRLSTIYASLDMTLHDQKVFLEHMGHEANINKDNYQCPIGIKEVRVMGTMLNNIEKGLSGNNVHKVPLPILKPGFCTANQTESSEVYTSESDTSLSPVKCNSSVESHTMTSMSRSTSFHTRNKVGTVKWAKKDTEDLKIYFHDFFQQCKRNLNNKGNLPGKKEILMFLRKCTPSCLQHLNSEQEAYMKTRIKLFNERKTMCLNASKKIKKITL